MGTLSQWKALKPHWLPFLIPQLIKPYLGSMVLWLFWDHVKVSDICSTFISLFLQLRTTKLMHLMAFMLISESFRHNSVQSTVGCKNVGNPGLNESVCDRKQTWTLNGKWLNLKSFWKCESKIAFYFNFLLFINDKKRKRALCKSLVTLLDYSLLL